jgi:malonyl-CoA/methylmalonyl-CoA synthetase
VLVDVAPDARLRPPRPDQKRRTRSTSGDLGEPVVAWAVPAPGQQRQARQLINYVAAELAPHKRPRVVRFVSALPRNDLAKSSEAAAVTGSAIPP